MESGKIPPKNSQENIHNSAVEGSDNNTVADVFPAAAHSTEGIADFPIFPLKKKKKGRFDLSKKVEGLKIETCNSFSNCQDTLNSEAKIKLNKNSKKESNDSKRGAISSVNIVSQKDTNKDIEACEIDLNFDLAKKKKKKPKNAIQTENNNIQTSMPEKKVIVEKFGSTNDAEYTYDFLLSRFYRIASQEHRISTPSPQKLTLNPPQVFRVGTKRTSFINFIDICRALHRPTQHLMCFVLVELGTSGSLDGNNHLIIKGRFQQKQIESVLRRYIKEYVRCITCSSMNTLMQKEIRLNFITCETCESKRSVAAIKSGFQAVTSKRASIRAKNT